MVIFIPVYKEIEAKKTFLLVFKYLNIFRIASALMDIQMLFKQTALAWVIEFNKTTPSQLTY